MIVIAGCGDERDDNDNSDVDEYQLGKCGKIEMKNAEYEDLVLWGALSHPDPWPALQPLSKEIFEWKGRKSFPTSVPSRNFHVTP